jgi:hypothetical protein
MFLLFNLAEMLGKDRRDTAPHPVNVIILVTQVKICEQFK